MKIHPGGGGPKKALECWFESETDSFSHDEKEGYAKLVFNIHSITGRLAADIKDLVASEDKPSSLTVALFKTAVESVEGFEGPEGEAITSLDEDTILAIHPKILEYITYRITKLTTLSGDELGFIKLPVDGS
uniref:Uncharacterized protein n=1 Tax=uncultured marine virus TaxID=186617 RepID=A0A0F7L5V3_9VIRU|nr:hypothetical protein [uncultured marine virus]